jgi:hypothetical protein
MDGVYPERSEQVFQKRGRLDTRTAGRAKHTLLAFEIIEAMRQTDLSDLR